MVGGGVGTGALPLQTPRFLENETALGRRGRSNFGEGSGS